METVGTGYGLALVSVAVFALLTMGLNLATGYSKGQGGVTAGGTPTEDYGSRLYRLNRAYINAVESFAIFGVIVAVCVLVGAAPFWVNSLAALVAVSRVALAYIHVQGIGAEAMGPRSIVFIFGFLLTAVLALMALVGALAL